MVEVICTVDVVLLTIRDDTLMTALIEREHAPFAGQYALPGGYIHAEEDADVHASAMRVIAGKAGIVPPYLEQLATLSGPGRDPRGWSLSIAHYALVPCEIIENAVGSQVHLLPVDRLPALPFDHARIIGMAADRLRNKSQYSSLPCFLAGDTFTLPQLQRIYEIVLGEKLNKVSFRRKVTEMDMLEPVEGCFESAGAHRPAQLYALKSSSRSKLMLLERGL
ncbi:NUDIX hydrolase [Massilia sp. CF038]|uniref:NUDIX hydrolase n=1 Tax=Massilia sp. CF038 TaxID=1881045 RepID=UPI0009109B78|nr:NUDIX hydrolase [Massilia sp. CF038]SHG65501.1 8-oxo-dGTP diphosphatase [Massilia sp. CF038]